ncbi:hypothetical protein D3C85_1597020 [compost metagenome]
MARCVVALGIDSHITAILRAARFPGHHPAAISQCRYIGETLRLSGKVRAVYDEGFTADRLTIGVIALEVDVATIGSNAG